VQAVLDQQRGLVEHHRRAGGGVGGDRGLGRGGDPRVGDAVEIGAGRGIGEHPRAERLAIERAVGGEDRRAEPHHQLAQRRLAARHHLAGEQIGVDDRRAALAQERRDGALAAGDAAGQADYLDHGRGVPRRAPAWWTHGGGRGIGVPMRPRAARYLTSATRPAEFPAADLPEIAFAGRSNVGKSSLINTLAGVSGLARTSRTPGRTRLLNWFRIDLPKATHGNDAVYFVDLPGYGFASVDRSMRASWRPLMESYLGERST
jgi:hypothetical protein